jgi:hypothetical protein
MSDDQEKSVLIRRCLSVNTAHDRLRTIGFGGEPAGMVCIFSSRSNPCALCVDACNVC